MTKDQYKRNFLRDYEPSTVAAIDDVVVRFKQPSCSPEKEGFKFSVLPHTAYCVFSFLFCYDNALKYNT